MNKYVTLVVRMPDDAEGKNQVREAFGLLGRHRTAMSLEDEMTVLELIEQHPDFPGHIAAEAREAARTRHATADSTTAPPSLGERMIVARGPGGLVDAAGWDCVETRHEAAEWLTRGLTLEYVSAQQVEDLAKAHRGGVMATTGPVGEVLSREQAQKDMVGY